MPTLLTMGRHGQASLGAANYDQLSELGYQQSRWLGEHLARMDHPVELVITGAMARHRQTAETLLAAAGRQPEWQQDDRWNEFNFEHLVHAFAERHPELKPENRADHRAMFRLLKLSLHAWAQGELDHTGLDETWQQFERRVAGALAQLPQDKNILIVSSGGALAMALRLILKAAPETMIALNLQTANTAVHECLLTREGPQLTRFNHLPHLANRPEHSTFF